MPDEHGPAAGREYLEGFLPHIGSERRLAVHTLTAYRRDIEALLAQLRAEPLGDVTVHHIRRAVAALHARGLAGSSLARMLSSWRGFFDYLARDHGFARNPCHGVRALRSPKRLPNALTADEAVRLVEIRGDGPLAVRDRALLELLYSSGLRLAELVSLDWPMLDWSEGTVRVTGKGPYMNAAGLRRKFAADAYCVRKIDVLAGL